MQLMFVIAAAKHLYITSTEDYPCEIIGLPQILWPLWHKIEIKI